MKQLEELEEKFLNEIKPLVNQFIEMRKQKLDMKQRMECVDIRKEIQAKTSEFKKAYTDMSSRECERIEAENARINAQRINIIKNMVQLKQDIVLRDTAIKEAKREGKDDDTYKLLCITQNEEIEKFNKMKQQCEKEQEIYKSNIGQIKELERVQKEFDEKYGDMDYITEREVYRLASFIGEKEESKTNRMSDGRVYYEDFDETKNFGDFIDIQEPAKEKEERDEQEAIKEKDKELQEIRKEIAEQVLAQKKKEYQEYLDEQMKKLEETIDEEIKDEEKTEDELTREDNSKKNKDNSKKGKISLWQRFKSIFRKRNVPLLEEGKEQAVKTKNRFAELKREAPTQKQQKEKVKSILNNREKGDETEKEGFDEVLTLLD